MLLLKFYLTQQKNTIEVKNSRLTGILFLLENTCSYGGSGSNGGNGGTGADDYTIVGFTVSSAYAIVGGSGGTGGSTNSSYGTATGFDIDLGSGGAGAGGGGRSFDAGLDGGNGGKGGGLVKLVGSNSVIGVL